MPLEIDPQRLVSDRAYSYRVLTRLLSACIVLLVLILFAAAKRWIAHDLGSLALGLLPLALLAAGWAGLKSRAQALADRDMESGRAMIVAIAAQLGRQDDDTLAAIAQKGGPAGEAARMILHGREARARREGPAQ